MRLPADEDLAWIGSFRRSVAASTDRLCGLCAEELGRDRFTTVTADLVPLLAACRWHERWATRVLRPHPVGGGTVWQLGQRHRVVRVPLGRVAIIATWNYPVQLLGVQLVQAIAGGNRVVVKPSERTPRTQAALLDLARAAGMGEDRLRWTQATREEGERLLAEDRFDHVVFTGSTEVGRTIASRLGALLTPSTLELSGCDGALVLQDADPDLAARAIFFAFTLNAGQTCMAPRRALVHREVHDAFVGRLAALVERAPVIPPPDPVQAALRARLVGDAVRLGARALPTDWSSRPGPVVVAACPPEAELVAGAHFAPVLAVVPVASDDEALALHARCPQRLATSLFTRDRARAERLAPTLGTGVVTINDAVTPTGHPGVGIGGVGPSGWGVTRGAPGLLAMTRPVFVSSTHPRVRVPTAPPSDRVRAMVEKFVRRRYGR